MSVLREALKIETWIHAGPYGIQSPNYPGSTVFRNSANKKISKFFLGEIIKNSQLYKGCHQVKATHVN